MNQPCRFSCYLRGAPQRRGLRPPTYKIPRPRRSALEESDIAPLTAVARTSANAQATAHVGVFDRRPTKRHATPCPPVGRYSKSPTWLQSPLSPAQAQMLNPPPTSGSSTADLQNDTPRRAPVGRYSKSPTLRHPPLPHAQAQTLTPPRRGLRPPTYKNDTPRRAPIHRT